MLVGSIAVLRITIAVLDLREGKFHRVRITLAGEEVNDGAAWVAQFKQLGYLVEGLACRIVAGVSHIVVRPAVSLLLGKIEMGVAAADHQREHRKLQLAITVLPLL